MREILYSDNAGSYHSAFLKMHIKTTEDLIDLERCSEQTHATFFHEYIHFLQDLLCTYGLLNITTIVDYIKESAKHILSRPDVSFTVPIDPEHSSLYDVQANWQLRKYWVGSGMHISGIRNIELSRVEEKQFATTEGNITAKRVVLEIDTGIVKSEYMFGSYCIVESMAFEMENVVYPAVLAPPADFPYRSVRLLCDHLYPGFSDDPLNVIALCDASLMYYDPGVVLLTMIQQMRDGSFMPAYPEQVYQYVYSNIEFDFHGINNVESLFESQSLVASKQLRDLFTISYLNDTKVWVENVMANAWAIRQRVPFVILNIVQGGPIAINNFFRSMLNDIGSPAMVNEHFVMAFMRPTAIDSLDIHPEYLWAVAQVYKIFSKGLQYNTYQCEMIGFCDSSAEASNTPVFTDERCRNAPWERSTDPNGLCPFGAIWRMWGLNNRIPTDGT